MCVCAFVRMSVDYKSPNTDIGFLLLLLPETKEHFVLPVKVISDHDGGKVSYNRDVVDHHQKRREYSECRDTCGDVII